MNGTVLEHSHPIERPGLLPRRDKAALRAGDWLSLAAAPTFAFMAAVTGVPSGGAHEAMCSSGLHASMLGGMVPMYLLMSVFHLAPWWSLMSRREPPSARPV